MRYLQPILAVGILLCSTGCPPGLHNYLEIENVTPYQITAVYAVLSSSDSEDWGRNRIAEPIDLGETRTVDLGTRVGPWDLALEVNTPQGPVLHYKLDVLWDPAGTTVQWRLVA